MTGSEQLVNQAPAVQLPVASPPPPAPTATGRNNNFNLLRLLLAALVILSHSFALAAGRQEEILLRLFHTKTLGDLAVDGFFLISGFLIVQSWQNRPQLPGFLKNRVLRIYPAFVMASLISAFVVGPLGANTAQYFSQFNVGQFLKGMLLLNMPVVPPVFQGQPFPMVNASMWTIEYEFRCYLIAALLGLIGIFRLRRCWALLVISVIVIALASDLYGTLNRIPSYAWLAFFPINPAVLAKFFAYFCAGGFFYSFRDRIHFKTAWMLAAIGILIPCIFWAKTADIALATLGAYVFFGLAFAQFSWLERFRNIPDISYGVYLYGWPSQKILTWYIPALNPWLLFPAALGFSCVLGLLSWRLVERPFLQLKRRTGGKDLQA